MPERYHIKTSPLAPRCEPIAEYCTIESGMCLKCTVCVKDTACIYNVNREHGFDTGQLLDPADSRCQGCMRCVQECKAGILSRVRNSRFNAIGNDYWTPSLVRAIWDQAETGRIPVSGAGYRGPFCGPGFDQMWTDMSEIVRPTRDGIHGREYVSTVIELGGKPEFLSFNTQGKLLTQSLSYRSLPLPIVLDIPPLAHIGESTRRSIARAAMNLRTLAVATTEDALGSLAEFRDSLIVKYDPKAGIPADIADVPIFEFADTTDVIDVVSRVKARSPQTIASIRLPLDERAADRASVLAATGAEIIHLQAGTDGQGLGACRGYFITDIVREVHLRLVSEATRDKVTLLLSGGIAMAEHMAKIIIIGVDGIGIDLAAAVALECRLCATCEADVDCPVAIDRVPEEYGSQRIINLIGAWHAQLIEVMGAMGIREVRRLRGEIGRAMFFKDLEHDNMAPLFGERCSALTSDVADATMLEKDDPAIVARELGWDFAAAQKPVAPSPSRYRNHLSKYRVVRGKECIGCGRCVEVCPQGVHHISGGKTLLPDSYLCIGPERCRARGDCCIDVCPSGAIRITVDPAWSTFGDQRWTPDLLVSTWHQAETGKPPTNGLEYRVGESGGGLDRIYLNYHPESPNRSLKPEEIDLSVPLNRRLGGNQTRVSIGIPFYGGGMSFGSVSLVTIIARARAYAAFDSFTCTGEGGYPHELTRYDDNVITQVATGLFGVSEETVRRVRIVEFKYAQGAKPGLGGHLLGDKVTPSVAKMREAVIGSSLFSPFPFHSVYSVEDHKKHVDWILQMNPGALVSVKVSTPTDVDMVAVGSYYAGAHIIHIDWSYGGTGAAPDIAKKNIAMPIEYAIPKVHRFLIEEGIRDEMTLVASGGLRSAWDIAKAIALGADAVVIGTSEMVALECVRCGRCESGRGCPRGIATTDPELATDISTEWAAQRLTNLFHSYAVQLQYILWRYGMRGIGELRGRSDLLAHRDYAGQQEPSARVVNG